MKRKINYDWHLKWAIYLSLLYLKDDYNLGVIMKEVVFSIDF